MASPNIDLSLKVDLVLGTIAVVIWVLCMYFALRTLWLSDEERMRRRGEAGGEKELLLNHS